LISFTGILAAAGHGGWPDWHLVVMVLGMMLFAAVVGGWLAQMLHLPRVTAYLMVGLTLGPSALDGIHENQLQYLIPLERLAMALVLFGMGCHFTLAHFRRIIRRVLRLSFGELGLTFCLVTGGMFALPYVVPPEWLGFPITLTMAAMFGALALATAPATTILVLKENDSEGPVTEYATALVALNNLAAILLFEILLIAVHSTGGTLSTSVGRELWFLARDIVGSVLLGVGAGLVISYGCGLTAKSSWLVLLLAIATLTLGANEALGTNYLLTFLAMGATVANAPPSRAKSPASWITRPSCYAWSFS
jgi:Kef-type K+ transport system membrane component KefB